MSSADLGRMMPGFEFLQGLMKTAGTTLPSIGQWVAPTLDPEELGKRIEELRTVQFWLEQNARMIATTVQALEVQRMTLSTLKTMNLSVGDMTEAFKLKVPPVEAPQATAAPEPAPAPDTPAEAKPGRSRKRGETQDSAAAAPGLVDPMQWWGALTQQFTELATRAVQDGGMDATGGLAGAMTRQATEMGRQATEMAGQAFKAVTTPAAAAAKAPTRSSAKGAAKTPGTRAAKAAPKAAPRRR